MRLFRERHGGGGTWWQDLDIGLEERSARRRHVEDLPPEGEVRVQHVEGVEILLIGDVEDGRLKRPEIVASHHRVHLLVAERLQRPGRGGG